MEKIALNLSCTNAQRHQIFSGALFKHLVIASLIKFEIYSLRMAMLCRGTLTAKEKINLLTRYGVVEYQSLEIKLPPLGKSLSVLLKLKPTQQGRVGAEGSILRVCCSMWHSNQDAVTSLRFKFRKRQQHRYLEWYSFTPIKQSKTDHCEG